MQSCAELMMPQLSVCMSEGCAVLASANADRAMVVASTANEGERLAVGSMFELLVAPIGRARLARARRHVDAVSVTACRGCILRCRNRCRLAEGRQQRSASCWPGRA